MAPGENKTAPFTPSTLPPFTLEWSSASSNFRRPPSTISFDPTQAVPCPACRLRPNSGRRPSRPYLLGEVHHARCLELQRRLIGQIAQPGRRADRPVAVRAPARSSRSAGPARRRRSPARAGLLRTGQIEVQLGQSGRRVPAALPGPVGRLPAGAPALARILGRRVPRSAPCGRCARRSTQLGIRGHTLPERAGVWGRTGQLAAVGWPSAGGSPTTVRG